MGTKFPTYGNKNSNKWELNFQPLEKILIGHVLEFVALSAEGYIYCQWQESGEEVKCGY